MTVLREVKVRLSAEVTDFQREISKATGSLDALVKKSGDSSGAASTMMGKLVQSANLQRDSWNTVSTTLLGAGAAMSGLATVVAATGIEYNTLQQTSRAALTAIMGSAEAANAQMDKLDSFARTSPFSKAVWISAQQQLLGFGVEASKVLPIMSAINEAVAATGGSNQDISELTRIFAQVSAAGKITATDLMQFGQRGVDAATLIGSQMGKTGAQIREEITKGTLDADKALVVLAAGMTERFEGASAGVKNTMTGAFDRVKAAWRDLSASIMESAVDPEGGGWFVGLVNDAADVLRVLEKLPQPLQETAAGMGAITGAALLTAGGLIGMIPRVLETYTAFKTLAAIGPRVSLGLKTLGGAATAAFGVLGVALAGAIAGYQVFAAKTAAAEARTDSFTSALDGQTDALNSNVRAVAAKQLQDSGAFDAAKKLGIGLDLVTDAALGNAAAQAKVAAAQKAAVDEADAAVAAKVALGESMSDEQNRAIELALATGTLTNAIGDTSDAYAAAKTEAADLAEANRDGADAASELADATDSATKSIWEQAEAALQLSGSHIGLESAILDAAEAVEKNGKTLADNTREGLDNQDALRKLAVAALTMRDAQADAGASTEEMRATMQRARDAFVSTAVQMGKARGEAEALADSYGLIPANVHTTITAKFITPDWQSLMANLQARVSANPLYVPVRTYGAQVRVATGGLVTGPGTGTSDSIPALLSNGEVVIRAASVARIGVDRLLHLNRTGELPRFAAGGLVGVAPRSQVMASVGAVAAVLSDAQIDRMADRIGAAMTQGAAAISRGTLSAAVSSARVGLIAGRG